MGKWKNPENFATSGQNLEFSWFSEDKNIFDFSETNNFPIEGSEIRHWTKNGFSPENKNYLRILNFF